MYNSFNCKMALVKTSVTTFMQKTTIQKGTSIVSFYIVLLYSVIYCHTIN